jgi:hypothetical protein
LSFSDNKKPGAVRSARAHVVSFNLGNYADLAGAVKLRARLSVLDDALAPLHGDFDSFNPHGEERGQRPRVLRLSKDEPWPRVRRRSGRILRDDRQEPVSSDEDLALNQSKSLCHGTSGKAAFAFIHAVPKCGHAARGSLRHHRNGSARPRGGVMGRAFFAADAAARCCALITSASSRPKSRDPYAAVYREDTAYGSLLSQGRP